MFKLKYTKKVNDRGGYMDFGRRLKEIRKANKLSQSELANQLGVTQATIANYEKNQRSPNIETLLLLSDMFEITVDYLVGRSHDIELSNLNDLSDVESADILTQLLLEDQFDKAKNFAKSYHQKHSLKKVFFKLFRYTLTKIGWLWGVGEITIAKEHQMSAYIDQLIEQIMVEIEVEAYNNIKILAMTAPGEKHTLGLKMLSKMLLVKGYQIYYIGEGVPLSDYMRTVDQFNPDVIILSVTTPYHLEALDEFFKPYKSRDLYLVGSGSIYYKNKQVRTLATYEKCLEAIYE